MQNLEQLKQKVAKASLEFIKAGTIVGIGTGSTVDYFIDALATLKSQIKGAVASSLHSAKRLRMLGIPIYEINGITHLDLYVDGADEVNPNKQLIKGRGAAITGEKILAALAHKFICIVDNSKQVEILGKAPLPVEVIPMARAYVTRKLVALGGDPKHRLGVVTDYGNQILDVHNLVINDPVALEEYVNNITGVVTVGLFAKRSADIVLVGSLNSIQCIEQHS